MTSPTACVDRVCGRCGHTESCHGERGCEVEVRDGLHSKVRKRGTVRMTPYTDGQQTPDPVPDPPEHEQLQLATNGLDPNGDLLPEPVQLGPDDPWPDEFF